MTTEKNKYLIMNEDEEILVLTFDVGETLRLFLPSERFYDNGKSNISNDSFLETLKKAAGISEDQFVKLYTRENYIDRMKCVNTKLVKTKELCTTRYYLAFCSLNEEAIREINDACYEMNLTPLFIKPEELERIILDNSYYLEEKASSVILDQYIAFPIQKLKKVRNYEGDILC